ncbi:guanine deaminase [Nakamurella flava]|uniref:Guanine deaminase n=1 Tax=Nakamurella flava TaxID=2576308 RepID=A0A4U6QFC6_9ACTN|nr:guanine deaminase [Nakamurella flava]TKV58860.1 guanine deaminase [Nakamurella flava]
MTLYRATVIDTPANPFTSDAGTALRVEQDGGVLVHDGRIAERGTFVSLQAAHPDEDVVDLSGGMLLPGFVDTHVHFPQTRVIGGLGMPLLEWLDKCALPEEARFAEPEYAAAVAREFLGQLVRGGTTSALVFGAHFESAMDELFTAAGNVGLNLTAGLVVSDRILREELLYTPAQAQAASQRLIDRWHGQGRMRYAVTPRFSLSAGDDMLKVCGQLLADNPGVWFTSHINENRAEIATVAELFGTTDYLESYARHGLVTDRSVFAHNVHPSDAELTAMAAAGSWTAHCPTSNASLGSGLFPLGRHVEHGVGVSLGSDVGGGTGLFLLKEGLQAYFMQQLLGTDGRPGGTGYELTPTHLLYLATAAGAAALGLFDRVGDLSVGKDFDAVWLRPDEGTSLAVNLANSADAADALARVFALATANDVAGVWLAGRQLS